VTPCGVDVIWRVKQHITIMKNSEGNPQNYAYSALKNIPKA